jgi:large subunit ribosomal protein L1
MKIQEAIKTIKQNAKEKFDASVELHINLDVDITKGQTVRYTTVLPNGTGKTKKVAVLSSQNIKSADLELSEEDIDKIISGKIKPKVDFEVLITEPKYMAKLAKAAKVLGPMGLMPNPKTGTVTENVEKAVEETKKGKVEIKTEKDAPLIHTILGKLSFEDKALVENFNAVITTLNQNRPAKTNPVWIKNIFVASSMGKSVPVELEETSKE